MAVHGCIGNPCALCNGQLQKRDDWDLARLEVAAQEATMRDGEMNDRQAAGVADRCVDGLLGVQSSGGEVFDRAKRERRIAIDKAIAKLEATVKNLAAYESGAREWRDAVAKARQELEALVLR